MKIYSLKYKINPKTDRKKQENNTSLYTKYGFDFLKKEIN